MDHIYTVTAVSFRTVHYIRKKTGKKHKVITTANERTWGWYPDKASAERAVEQNRTDMCEAGYYTHAVVEKVAPGIIAFPELVSWWRFKPLPGGSADAQGVRCLTPKHLRRNARHGYSGSFSMG